MILVPIERAYTSSYYIVINSNFGPMTHILHRFRDTATYWMKIAYFSYTALLFGATAPYVPFGISR